MELIFLVFWLLRCRLMSQSLRFKWYVDEDDDQIDEARGMEYQEAEAVPLVLCIYRLERVIVAEMLKENAGRCIYDSFGGYN